MKKTTPLNDMTTERLFPGHVVKPGAAPRLRGYDLHGDLAPNYRLPELLLLSLTGELPSGADAVAFEKAMAFLMNTPVTSAGAHAARVTQVGRGGATAVVSVGITALIAEANHQIEQASALLDLVEGRTLSPGAAITASSAEERQAVAQLRSQLPWTELGVLAHDLGIVPAVLAVFYRCGLHRTEQWLIALVHGRMTSSLAEGFGDFTRSFASLPVELPQVRYVMNGVKV